MVFFAEPGTRFSSSGCCKTDRCALQGANGRTSVGAGRDPKTAGFGQGSTGPIDAVFTVHVFTVSKQVVRCEDDSISIPPFSEYQARLQESEKLEEKARTGV